MPNRLRAQRKLSQFQDDSCAKNESSEPSLDPLSLKFSDFPTGHMVGGTLSNSRPRRLSSVLLPQSATVLQQSAWELLIVPVREAGSGHLRNERPTRSLRLSEGANSSCRPDVMARERSPFKVILNALPVAMTLEEVLPMRLIGVLLV
jgi:hypothetical protein